jgi:hypothetical protein
MGELGLCPSCELLIPQKAQRCPGCGCLLRPVGSDRCAKCRNRTGPNGARVMEGGEVLCERCGV